MIKKLKLINNERKSSHILSAKACDYITNPGNDFCYYKDRSFCNAQIDYCRSDYAGCGSNIFIDTCEIDTVN